MKDRGMGLQMDDIKSIIALVILGIYVYLVGTDFAFFSIFMGLGIYLTIYGVYKTITDRYSLHNDGMVPIIIGVIVVTLTLANAYIKTNCSHGIFFCLHIYGIM